MMGLAWFPVPWVVCFCCGGELNVSLGARLGMCLVSVLDKLVGSHGFLGCFWCPDIVWSVFAWFGCWTRQLVNKLGVVIVAAS
jgi:hypothetical protein